MSQASQIITFANGDAALAEQIGSVNLFKKDLFGSTTVITDRVCVYDRFSHQLVCMEFETFDMANRERDRIIKEWKGALESNETNEEN